MSVKIILNNGNEHIIPDLADVTGRVITELSGLNISSMVTAYLTENGVNINAEDVEQIVNEQVLDSSNTSLQDAVRLIVNEFCFSTADGTSSFAPAIISILNDSNNPVLDSSNEKLQNAIKYYITYEAQADSTTKLIAINSSDSKFEGYNIDTAGDFSDSNLNSIATIKSLTDLESALVGDLTGGRTSDKADVYIPNIIVTDDALPETGDYCTGDYCIIKNTQTAYMYMEDHWQALNGNYNANNIYFDKDMMVTTNIGYITTTNGSGTIPSEGKNLEQVFEAMFVQEQDPTKTDPSVSISLTGAGSYEVGTTITGIKYSTSFADGSYSYGPEPTGAEPTKWEVTSTAGYSSTVNPEGKATTVATSLSDIAIDDVLVLDTTNFSVTAKATHTAGAVPKTNKGNDCTDLSKQITEGTKSKKSSAITGYRSFFYGAITVPTSELTSEIIRGLTNAGNYNTEKAFTIKADGATNLKAFIVAIPDSNTRSGITKVNSTAGMTIDMTESYVKGDNISVADWRGTIDEVDQNPVSYKIYAWEPASIDSGTVHEFTLG